MAMPEQSQELQGGVDDAGRYFRYMTEFVGFTPEDASAIRESALIIEKYIPSIVGDFYAHLLRYPPTRKHFLKPDGSIDQDYLKLRMHHLGNFWRRTASGEYDDEYARYIAYVGRAHTARGADPGIYIAERYVIGQVGFVQHAISSALSAELNGIDDELEARAVQAWNKLMMVILEMLARAYGYEKEPESEGVLQPVDRPAVKKLAVDTYERSLGLVRPVPTKPVLVGRAEEIPDGERKLITIDNRSIGVFHHEGGWYAVRNSCLHRGGPVATGCLEQGVLECPWHGYRYKLVTGELLIDSSVKLESYPVEVREGRVWIEVPELFHVVDEGLADAARLAAERPEFTLPELEENEFFIPLLPSGRMRKVMVDGQAVAVYNLEGRFYATQNACTHQGGSLSEGTLDGGTVRCPVHGARFDVTSGEVRSGPARRPLQAFSVTVEGSIGRVERKGNNSPDDQPPSALKKDLPKDREKTRST